MPVSDIAVVAAVLGGFIVVFGLVSMVIKEKIYLSEASELSYRFY